MIRASGTNATSVGLSLGPRIVIIDYTKSSSMIDTKNVSPIDRFRKSYQHLVVVLMDRGEAGKVIFMLLLARSEAEALDDG